MERCQRSASPSTLNRLSSFLNTRPCLPCQPQELGIKPGSPAGIEKKRQGVARTKVAVGLPLAADGSALLLPGVQVHAFLPVAPFGLRFLVQVGCNDECLRHIEAKSQ